MRQFKMLFLSFVLYSLFCCCFAEVLQGKIGDICVNTQGIYWDGYMKYPKIFKISYQSKLGTKLVDIEYTIASGEKGNFTVDENGENMTYCAGIDTLQVSGHILYKQTGKVDTLATFSHIIYNTAPNLFSAYLVVEGIKLGLSNTLAMSRLGISSSKIKDAKFKGKKVAFYRVNPDFTLSFDANPTANKLTQKRTK